MGNLRSVQKAFEKVGSNAIITNEPDEIKKADKIVLPGVGSFKDAMNNLQSLGLVDILNEEVLIKKKPFLGICLGMQLIAKKSYENGENEGLGWVNAEVVKFDFSNKNKKLKVPHVGWNEIVFNNENKLLDGIDELSDVYFVHSYFFRTDEDIVSTYTEYGFNFVSSINKDNIYAFQFHPEKSQKIGLKIIENFLNIS